MKQYRIEWTNLSTNNKGHGVWFPSSDKEMLQSTVSTCNKTYKGVIHHILKER